MNWIYPSSPQYLKLKNLQDTPELSPNNLDSTTIDTYDVGNKVKAKFFTSDKHHEIAEIVEVKKMTPQATLPTR